MLRATLLGTAVLLTLTGCARIADSRFNPVNWFGSSTAAPVDPNGQIRPLVPENNRNVEVDNRTMVQSITSLSIDRTPSGAIVHAVGVAQTQGYFNAELVSLGITDGVLDLEFRAQAPSAFEVPGTTQSRQISAAYVIDRGNLSAVRSVRVTAATNAWTSTR